MGNHIKYVIKGIILTAIILFLLTAVNRVLVPKFYYDDTWPTTTGYRGFYQMDKDSIDVLFLGSSHATASFNPQYMYDAYGIRSYNLGGEQQSMLASYYWLKEALKTQNPSVVILDTTFVFQYMKYEPLNCEESATRKAIDAMKWSGNKLDAIRDVCEIDDKQEINSYLFPNIRFHERWMNLVQNDFKAGAMEKHYELKGYVPLGNHCGNDWYAPYNMGETEELFEAYPVMMGYLDKIAQTCKASGITLILTNAPTTMADITKYNTITNYATSNGLVYIDYNESGIYYSTGLVFADDMNDDDHANIWGSEKITSHMANLLLENGLVQVQSDEQWGQTADYYANLKNNYNLKNIWDIFEYIDAINNERYTTIMAVNYDGTFFMTEDVLEKFKTLGIQMDIMLKDGSYIAVIQDGCTEEQVDMKPINLKTMTANGREMLDITSAGGGENANMCSIKVGEEEKAANQIGLNIVVYDNETMRVLDSLWYTTGIFRY